MPFLAYIAIVLVSLGGILFELDWLTKPKLDTKSPAQVASTVVPLRTVPKVDGPSEGPSPVNVKKQETEQTSDAPAPATAPVGQAAGTAPAVTPAPFPPVVADAKAEPAPQAAPQPPAQATTTAVPPQPQPAAQATLPAVQTTTAAAAPQPQLQQPQVQAPAQPIQVAAKQAPNSCDVQGCTSAYQSFRASDCSYQPMEGPRKFGEKPPVASQRAASVPREPALRRPSRDAELRDVERTVRRITAGDDAGYDSRMGRSEVIVIERSERGW
jgi:hypothetical protein